MCEVWKYSGRIFLGKDRVETSVCNVPLPLQYLL